MQNKMLKCIIVLGLVNCMLAGVLFFGGWQTKSSPEYVKTSSKNTVRQKMDETQNMKKKIAITFDDGPSPNITRQLLEGLKERNVKATFFVMGEKAELYPDVVKLMYDDGHLIGNHTYHHVQLTAVGEEQFKQEIIATNEVIKSITGETPQFIRPPFGNWDKKYEDELYMLPVLWDIDPLDWCCNSSDCIYQRVVTKVKENDIILMHDCYEPSVTAALQIIDTLQKQGYEFVTVDEIILE